MYFAIDILFYENAAKINQILSIDRDMKLYAYGGASATVSDVKKRSLPQLPKYDN